MCQHSSQDLSNCFLSAYILPHKTKENSHFVEAMIVIRECKIQELSLKFITLQLRENSLCVVHRCKSVLWSPWLEAVDKITSLYKLKL